MTLTIRNRAKALKKKESGRPQDEATSARKADQEPVFPQVLERPLVVEFYPFFRIILG